MSTPSLHTKEPSTEWQAQDFQEFVPQTFDGQMVRSTYDLVCRLCHRLTSPGRCSVVVRSVQRILFHNRRLSTDYQSIRTGSVRARRCLVLPEREHLPGLAGIPSLLARRATADRTARIPAHRARLLHPRQPEGGPAEEGRGCTPDSPYHFPPTDRAVPLALLSRYISTAEQCSVWLCELDLQSRLEQGWQDICAASTGELPPDE